MPDDEFLAQLKAFEGREIAGLAAPDEVNQAMIRHWVAGHGRHEPGVRRRRRGGRVGARPDHRSRGDAAGVDVAGAPADVGRPRERDG